MRVAGNGATHNKRKSHSWDLAEDVIIAPHSTTRVLQRHQLIFNKSPVRLLIFAPPASHTSISKTINTPALRHLSYILGGIGMICHRHPLAEPAISRSFFVSHTDNYRTWKRRRRLSLEEDKRRHPGADPNASSCSDGRQDLLETHP